MGVIYKFENTENGKIYIGQTVMSFKRRLSAHLLKASKDVNEVGSLHYDLKHLGLNAFIVSIIEECKADELSDRERYWINYYDSYKNGYNKNSGGAGGARVTEQENKVISLANEGKTLTEIAGQIGCSLSAVRSVLEVNDVDYKRGIHGGPLKVVMYNNDWKPLKLWNSISESYKYINKGQSSESTHQHRVRIACDTREQVFSHYWALLEDLITYKDGHMLIATTPYDMDIFEGGGEYEIKDGRYIVAKTDIKSLIRTKCRYCGKVLNTGENICSECKVRHPRCYEAIQDEQTEIKSRRIERARALGKPDDYIVGKKGPASI